MENFSYFDWKDKRYLNEIHNILEKFTNFPSFFLINQDICTTLKIIKTQDSSKIEILKKTINEEVEQIGLSHINSITNIETFFNEIKKLHFLFLLRGSILEEHGDLNFKKVFMVLKILFIKVYILHFSKLEDWNALEQTSYNNEVQSRKKDIFMSIFCSSQEFFIDLVSIIFKLYEKNEEKNKENHISIDLVQEYKKYSKVSDGNKKLNLTDNDDLNEISVFIDFVRVFTEFEGFNQWINGRQNSKNNQRVFFFRNLFSALSSVFSEENLLFFQYHIKAVTKILFQNIILTEENTGSEIEISKIFLEHEKVSKRRILEYLIKLIYRFAENENIQMKDKDDIILYALKTYIEV